MKHRDYCGLFLHPQALSKDSRYVASQCSTAFRSQSLLLAACAGHIHSNQKNGQPRSKAPQKQLQHVHRWTSSGGSTRGKRCPSMTLTPTLGPKLSFVKRSIVIFTSEMLCAQDCLHISVHVPDGCTATTPCPVMQARTYRDRVRITPRHL